MSETLKLPEKTRIMLGELHKARLQAEKEFQLVMGSALDFLGLDPSGQHQINFDTGVITPAPSPDNVTPINEAAG